MLSGFHSAQGRVDAVAYWVISDHFEELGRPPRLFHNGFGLLSVGNLRKPRYWAVHLAAHMGDEVLAAELDGDGAGASFRPGPPGTRTARSTSWSGTAPSTRSSPKVIPGWTGGSSVTVTGLDAGTYQARLARVDQRHSNVVARCPPDVTWPDDGAVGASSAERRAGRRERLPDVIPDGGAAHFSFDLPMPGIARIRLSAGEATARHE